ncbi:NCA2-domain-containing protein [Clavulina sp. PMI_390]|nr:NCA2-domain-containing protein [Clavulina sp. PMI_390]
MATEQSRQLLKYSPKRHARSGRKRVLKAHHDELLSNLNAPSTSHGSILNTLEKLDANSKDTSPPTATADATEDADEVSGAVLLKSAVSALSLTMDSLLQEALEAEEELEWWRSIESSRWNTAYYLLQTSPIRMARLAHDIAIIARRNNVAFSFNNLNAETFRLRIAPHLQVFSSLFPTFSRHQATFLDRYTPTELARQECSAHRKELERLRDVRAQQLGQLGFLGSTSLTALQAFEDEELMEASISTHSRDSELALMITTSMRKILEGDDPLAPEAAATTSISQSQTLVSSSSLQTLVRDTLSKHSADHAKELAKNQRPPRWALIWPRLVILPPLILIGINSVYKNRSALRGNLSDAYETMMGFWTQWVVEPVREILKTVRTGGDDSAGRVISKDGLKSDMESLERMVIDLASEKHKWSEAELQQLSAQVRQGDLTTVLKVYEGDIKAPLRSAVSGTLIRSLLIQIQKAKVDIDLALAGIDKLLRSQELTFGFVGVAPSLAVLYVFAGWTRYWLVGGDSRTAYGGRARRRSSFYAIRRIERLLTQASSNSVPSTHPHTAALIDFYSKVKSYSAPPLPGLPMDAQTHGQLLVSLTSLRQYGEKYLKKRSAQREAFMDDLADLEDPKLSRDDKLRVVERMWRSWGATLGWGSPRFT